MPSIESKIKKIYPAYKIKYNFEFSTLNQFGLLLKYFYFLLVKNRLIRKKIKKKYFPLIPKKATAQQIIIIVSEDLRKRIIYQKEPKGIEVLNINFEKILYQKFQADCDDMATISAVIFSILIPRASIFLLLTSHTPGHIPHHAYTELIINNKKYIIDLVRRKPQKKIIYQKLKFLFKK